jgi:hypothetical protein|tara:strand:- start:963 stop:1325 length:363 start_codon:yes stop_codon:yes gene_type:complete
MALKRVGLGSIFQVGNGTTQVVYSVGSAKTAYIRALEIHSLDETNIANVQVHIVPATGAGGVGTASTITRIARLGISTDDTYFFENAYPITLTSNGDSVQIYNENSANAINVLVLGDREG